MKCSKLMKNNKSKLNQFFFYTELTPIIIITYSLSKLFNLYISKVRIKRDR